MTTMDYLKSAQKSLFRFESLQEYKIPNEDMTDLGMQAWWNFTKNKTSQGVTMQRVRLVIEPLSEYTRKELAVFKKSIEFGDDIRTITEENLNELGFSLKDFWLIDDIICLEMNYNDKGEFLGFNKIDLKNKEYIDKKILLLNNSKKINNKTP